MCLRALAEYHARVAAEGEYDDEELPPDLVDQLEEALPPEKAAFVVRMGSGQGRGRGGGGGVY